MFLTAYSLLRKYNQSDNKLHYKLNVKENSLKWISETKMSEFFVHKEAIKEKQFLSIV